MRVFIFLAEKVSRSLKAALAGKPAKAAFCIGIFFSGTVAAGQWAPLAKDGIHDPRSPAIKILQEPAEALSKLTADKPHVGNQVHWIQSLEKKEIQPREKIFPKTEIRKLDRDSILNAKGGMPAVRFPHRQHTEWLDCVNCHNGIFSTTPGETQISMLKILEGEQCGICHGAVAFPLTECLRCHSIPRPGQAKPELPAGVSPGFHLPQKQVP